MKLVYTRNTTARKVLAAVKPLLRAKKRTKHLDLISNYAYVHPYVNCREQGFAIASNTCTVAFSEDRNSDDIVVYVGGSHQFDFNTNIPSDEVYKNRRYFHAGAYALAAKFIVKALLSERVR
jgi:hypothetical protein